MKISKISAQFDCDIDTVWNIVTNNHDYAWRSDVSKVEILNEVTFIEYDKKGFMTKFTITQCKPNEIYAFTLDNQNLYGRWQGKFFASSEGTCIEFIEEITFKNPLLKIIGMFMNIKKIQETYIHDLKIAISNK